MGMRLTIFAAAALLTGASTGAMAQYCPPGYALYGGVCQPIRPSYSNPASGAVSGGAIGTATGTLTGTANMLSPPPACAAGYVYYNGACYPGRR
jgi:hypothetical protein